ncbi:hypothetical protein CC86DRAFT_387035 [Ophiobolus disseminans]|uniref:Uncharacterized protein n=1 Tax=Ophiobolus disseminans TaxID=1469910 RepID=A0A6A6ZHN8_9PLEO|nr:hypothetical protein CC86DRAFT_387035 [Ophiobolus disseminans]
MLIRVWSYCEMQACFLETPWHLYSPFLNSLAGVKDSSARASLSFNSPLSLIANVRENNQQFVQNSSLQSATLSIPHGSNALAQSRPTQACFVNNFQHALIEFLASRRSRLVGPAYNVTCPFRRHKIDLATRLFFAASIRLGRSAMIPPPRGCSRRMHVTNTDCDPSEDAF